MGAFTPMATTDFDFYNTRNQIIQRAFRIVGALSEGEQMSAYQIDQGVNALNALVKSWQTRHIFLWRLEVISKSVTSGSSSFTVTADPAVVGIDRAYWVDGTTDHRIQVVSFREYQDIPDKQSTGKPLAITFDAKESPTFYLYPELDETTTIKILAICKLKDYDGAGDTGEIPVRFHNALIYGLACDLADEYGLPLGERQFIKMKADEFFSDAKRSDRERVDSSFVKSAY